MIAALAALSSSCASLPAPPPQDWRWRDYEVTRAEVGDPLTVPDKGPVSRVDTPTGTMICYTEDAFAQQLQYLVTLKANSDLAHELKPLLRRSEDEAMAILSGARGKEAAANYSISQSHELRGELLNTQQAMAWQRFTWQIASLIALGFGLAR